MSAAIAPEPLAPLPPVGIWTPSFGALDHGAVRDIAAEVEALGYGSMWFPESPVGEPFVRCALVLASTTTLVAGTGIANIWLRHGATMQATARALTAAFPERFLLGIGVSHALMVDALFAEGYTRPIPRMRAYLDVMDSSLPARDDVATRPPRVLAALGDAMLGLARDRAEGAHPYLVTPEHTAHAREVLGPDRLLIPEQAVVLSADRTVVLSRARQHLSTYLRLDNYRNNWLRLGFSESDLEGGGSEALCDALVASGDADAIRRRIGAHLDAGADHVVIQALGEGLVAPPLDQWRELAEPLSFKPGG